MADYLISRADIREIPRDFRPQPFKMRIDFETRRPYKSKEYKEEWGREAQIVKFQCD